MSRKITERNFELATFHANVENFIRTNRRVTSGMDESGAYNMMYLQRRLDNLFHFLNMDFVRDKITPVGIVSTYLAIMYLPTYMLTESHKRTQRLRATFSCSGDGILKALNLDVVTFTRCFNMAIVTARCIAKPNRVEVEQGGINIQLGIAADIGPLDQLAEYLVDTIRTVHEHNDFWEDSIAKGKEIVINNLQLCCARGDLWSRLNMESDDFKPVLDKLLSINTYIVKTKQGVEHGTAS